jgi:hypothetical protein
MAKPQVRKRYGIAARELLIAEFSLDRVVRDTFAIYHEIAPIAEHYCATR